MKSAYGRIIPPENERLTHVGPGTPMGELLRRYWQPVGVSDTLKDLPKRHQQAVLPHLTIVQMDLSRAGERIRIRGVSAGVEVSFEAALDDALRPAGICHDSVGLHVAKLHPHGEGRVRFARQHGKPPGDLPVPGTRPNLRQLQLGRVVLQ